jgi:hypothetical protein
MIDSVLLARHPFSSAIVLAALAATAAVFVFARPEYHSPNEGSLVKIDLSKYPPAVKGWRWAGGQPGFRFGEDEEKWNVSQVTAAELAPARRAAPRWRVARDSVRPLAAMRLGPGDLSMIVAATNAADQTCLGFVRPKDPVAFYCPGRLGPQPAFVLVTTRGPYETEGRTIHPTFLTGVARADVTRVVIDQPPDWPNGIVYDREQGSVWGTFELSLSDSRDIRVTVYGKRGVIATVPIDVTQPADLLIPVTAG